MKKVFLTVLLCAFPFILSAQRIALDFSTKRFGIKKGEEWIVSPTYNEISLSVSGDGIVAARKGSRWGALNMVTGETVVPCGYDKAFVFRNGYAKVVKDGRQGFIDMYNNWYDTLPASAPEARTIDAVPPVPVEDDTEYRIGDYIPVKDENGTWGYRLYDELVIEPKFSYAGPFSEGLAAVAMNGKYGFIDKDGKCVIPYRYEYTGKFNEGLAVARMNGKYGYVDKTGRSAIPYKFDFAGGFSNGLAAVKFNGEDFFIDTDGQMYRSKEDISKTYSSFAKQYVEAFVNKWQKKGRYEKTADWQKRVNESTRQIVIDSLLQVAKNEYIAYQSKSVQNSHSLVEYDADGEIFLVYDERFGSLLVPVPIAQAENFEKDFASVSRENTYYVANDNLGLKSAVFTTPDGKSYTYQNDAMLEFASVDIVYNFDSIDIDAADDGGVQNRPQINRKAMNVGKSDVDLGIPVTNVVNDRTFAVIIANEKYQMVSGVDYAENDGRTFREYCIRTLGIPEKNIRFTPNATLVNMWAQVDWLVNIAQAYNGEANLIFYYAGHGVPDEQSRDAYLLPVDGSGTNIKTGYRLGELYSSLSRYPTRQTVVLLDACFSGAERSGDMLVAARGVALKAKKEVPEGNMVVFSAASGDETAYQYEDKGHGLFTYFLLKKLQETGGNVSLGALSGYISEQVSRHSIIENSKSQTPTVIPSGSLSGTWSDMKLRP